MRLTDKVTVQPYQNEQKNNFYQTKTILLIVAALHLIGLIACAIDFYYLKWYIIHYNDGLVPDQQMFQIRGNSVLSGKLPYEDLASWESLAPPLSMYLLAIPLIFENIIPIPLAFSYRIYFSIYNLLTSWLLIKIGEKTFPHNRKFLATILYGMGPFMVMQAAFAGSDESMGTFLMILVVYLIINDKPILATIAIGIGTSIKYYPFLLIPYLLATRETFRSQVKYGIFSLISVILFFAPFYFVNPDNFMLQFNNRLQSVPWDSPGNSGLLMLIDKLQIVNLTEIESQYKIFWISSLILLSMIQILKRYNTVEDAGLVPSIFFILYPKFFFSYFAIILPFYCIGFVYRKSPWILWVIMNIGLFIGGMVNDRVVGYSSVYRQEEGNVPILLAIGILLFYAVWLFNWLLILLKRDFQLKKGKSIFPQISIFNPS